MRVVCACARPLRVQNRPVGKGSSDRIACIWRVPAVVDHLLAPRVVDHFLAGGCLHLRSSSRYRQRPMTATPQLRRPCRRLDAQPALRRTRESAQRLELIPPISPIKGKAIQSVCGSAHMGTSARRPAVGAMSPDGRGRSGNSRVRGLGGVAFRRRRDDLRLERREAG